MQPADIRVEPWVWFPRGRRPKGGIGSLILVASACLAIGYLVGREPRKTADIAQPPTAPSTKSASAAGHQKTTASALQTGPPPGPGLVKTPETDLAKPPPTDTQSPQPRVVLLNPGAASQSKRVAEAMPALPPRRVADDRPRADGSERRGMERERAQMRDYHQLRHYMLGR
jgi:hypothetical protein